MKKFGINKKYGDLDGYFKKLFNEQTGINKPGTGFLIPKCPRLFELYTLLNVNVPFFSEDLVLSIFPVGA